MAAAAYEIASPSCNGIGSISLQLAAAASARNNLQPRRLNWPAVAQYNRRLAAVTVGGSVSAAVNGQRIAGAGCEKRNGIGWLISPAAAR